MLDKNFGLNEQEFDELVEKLKSGDEQLFEKIFLSQFENTINYVMIKYKTSQESAYDVCMDGLIYLRKLLIGGKVEYGNLRALYNLISSQKYIKYIEKSRKIQLTEKIPEVEIRQGENKEKNLALLNKAWNKLGNECQKILKGFYYNNQRLYDLAEVLGKTPAAIRKQKERCIDALRLNIRHNIQL